MSHGYSKQEIIGNIRSKRKTSMEELKDLASTKMNSNMMHKYAIVEARRELKRRQSGKIIRRTAPRKMSYNDKINKAFFG